MISKQVVGIFAIFWAFDRTRTSPSTLALQEIQSLREEVARTRDIVLSLEAVSSDCSWQVWTQGWLLKLSGLADILLVILLIWLASSRRASSASPAALTDSVEEDTTEALGSSDLSTEASVIPENPSSTSSRSSFPRPTRPSDLKKWRT